MNSIAFTIAIWAFAELFALIDFMFIVTYKRNPKHWTRAIIRFVVISLFAGLKEIYNLIIQLCQLLKN